jgi:hypothetical protein
MLVRHLFLLAPSLVLITRVMIQANDSTIQDITSANIASRPQRAPMVPYALLDVDWLPNNRNSVDPTNDE